MLDLPKMRKNLTFAVISHMSYIQYCFFSTVIEMFEYEKGQVLLPY